MQYINVGVERNLQRSIFIPHKRDMIGGNHTKSNAEVHWNSKEKTVS